MNTLTYDDTHITEAELASVVASSYDMAVMADESGRQPRYLFSTPLNGGPYVARSPWRRLVVHVDDIAAPGAEARLLATLGVQLQDVPF